MKQFPVRAKRLCSRIFQISSSHEQCGKNLSIFRMGVLEDPNDYYILHNHILGHVVIFPEDIPEDEHIVTVGIVD